MAKLAHDHTAEDCVELVSIFDNLSKDDIAELLKEKNSMELKKFGSLNNFNINLIVAINESDPNFLNEFLNDSSVYFVYEEQYKNLVKKYTSGTKTLLTDEDIQVILNYRLKYALPIHVIPFNREVLHRRCPESLREQLAELDKFNVERSRFYYANKNDGLKK